MSAHGSSANADPSATRSKPMFWRLKDWYWERRRTIILTFLVLMFSAVLLAPYVLITIPPGHFGVLWLRFFGGTVVGEAYGEGLRPIFPWDRIYVYDGRLQAHAATYDAVTSDGLTLQIKVTFRWRLLQAALGDLHRDIGPDYLHILLVPEVGSVTREIVSSYTTQQLISGGRSTIQTNAFQAVVARPSMFVNVVNHGTSDTDRYVHLEDLLISSVILPPEIRHAVERKLEQAQISEEYKYRVETEKLESQRKAIEAEGIKEFQQTVQSGISDTYLKWRGIEATLELARSPNAKTVVIGSSNGLPLIFNTGDDVKAPLGRSAPSNEGPPAPQPNGPKKPASPSNAPLAQNDEMSKVFNPGSLSAAVETSIGDQIGKTFSRLFAPSRDNSR